MVRVIPKSTSVSQRFSHSLLEQSGEYGFPQPSETARDFLGHILPGLGTARDSTRPSSSQPRSGERRSPPPLELAGMRERQPLVSFPQSPLVPSPQQGRPTRQLGAGNAGFLKPQFCPAPLCTLGFHMSFFFCRVCIHHPTDIAASGSPSSHFLCVGREGLGRWSSSLPPPLGTDW